MADNCFTCGIQYRDDTPHPPSVCAEHAGKELKKAKAALEGALSTISRLTRESDELRKRRSEAEPMDTDELACGIAAILDAKKVKYKFLASGSELDPVGRVIWETMVVDAYDPVRREFSRLDSLQAAERFIEGLGR